MKISPSAAADFLSMLDLVSWESGHRARALSVLQQFAAGALDVAAVRAALGSPRGAGAGRDAPSGVAVIPLTGVLTPTDSIFTFFGFGTSLRAFGQQLRAAAADASVTAIVVLTDSPGGSTGLVPETAALVRQIRAQKPIIAAVSGLNASAAYWITSNATAIEATQSGLIGAIGVYAIRPSFARQLQNDGVDVDVISAGRFKTEGIAALPMTDAERAATQARVDENYDGFVADVAAGRHVAGSAVRAGFGEGRVVSAKRAAQLGMIDRVVNVEDTIARALTMTGARAWLGSAEEDEWCRRRLGLPPVGSTARHVEDGADDLDLRRLL